MTRRETVHSELSQSEKRDTLLNDRRAHKNTYFSHAHPDEGGRFAASDQPQRYAVGWEAVTRYPAGPGVEPPTGVAIDQMEPVGTQVEIQRNLDGSGDGEGYEMKLSPPSDPPRGDVQRGGMGSLQPSVRPARRRRFPNGARENSDE